MFFIILTLCIIGDSFFATDSNQYTALVIGQTSGMFALEAGYLLNSVIKYAVKRYYKSMENRDESLH